MRWDRIFEEIEQQSRDVAAQERDALAEDIVVETLRRTSWFEFLTGTIELRLMGGLVVRGDVFDVAQLIELRHSGRTVWVVPDLVMSVVTSGERITPRASVLTWRSQLGAAFRSRVQIHTADGMSQEGELSSVGGDYLTVVAGAKRREIIVPRSAVAAVTLLEPRW